MSITTRGATRVRIPADLLTERLSGNDQPFAPLDAVDLVEIVAPHLSNNNLGGALLHIRAEDGSIPVAPRRNHSACHSAPALGTPRFSRPVKVQPDTAPAARPPAGISSCAAAGTVREKSTPPHPPLSPRRVTAEKWRRRSQLHQFRSDGPLSAAFSPLQAARRPENCVSVAQRMPKDQPTPHLRRCCPPLPVRRQGAAPPTIAKRLAAWHAAPLPLAPIRRKHGLEGPDECAAHDVRPAAPRRREHFFAGAGPGRPPQASASDSPHVSNTPHNDGFLELRVELERAGACLLTATVGAARLPASTYRARARRSPTAQPVNHAGRPAAV